MNTALRASMIVLAATTLPYASANAAAGTLTVNDASQVQYVANPDGKIYFRNLNQFDPTWAGCCYAFWIDVSTDGGRAQYAAFLSAFFTRQKIMFYGDSAGGAFSHVGSF